VFDPAWPPCEPLLPREEDCEPPGLGIEAPPPPEEPPPLGMLGELRPPPELPPEEPLLPDEPPLEGEEGIDDEDDCCCCGQPPIRNAQTAPMAVACAATTGRDLRER
jgi:hypothetical protein